MKLGPEHSGTVLNWHLDPMFEPLLCCVFEQDTLHFILCLVLVQPLKKVQTWLINCWLGRTAPNQTKHSMTVLLISCHSEHVVKLKFPLISAPLKNANRYEILHGQWCMTRGRWQWEYDNLWKSITYCLGLVARKPVFGVSDKAIFKSPRLQRLARKLKFHLSQVYIWYFPKRE